MVCTVRLDGIRVVAARREGNMLLITTKTRSVALIMSQPPLPSTQGPKLPYVEKIEAIHYSVAVCSVSSKIRSSCFGNMLNR